MFIYPRMRAVILFFMLLPLTGCIFRTRQSEVLIDTIPLKEATLEQLVETINRSASRLQTLNDAIDISVSVGGPKKGEVKDYTSFGGYLLVRKPGMLRMIGQFPVVGSTMFDMASNGKTFELSIPPQKKFFIGTNQIGTPSEKPVENLRPQAILDALLLKAIDQDEIAVLEHGTETVKDQKRHKDALRADYVVNVIRKEDNHYLLSRKIVFSRVDLLPHRQFIYDKQGELLTDASYGTFTDYGGGISLPSTITIQRPIEEYEIGLTVTKARLNGPIEDEKFLLPQPPGSQLINLDDKKRATAAENQANRPKDKP